jgi:hypothetical protein
MARRTISSSCPRRRFRYVRIVGLTRFNLNIGSLQEEKDGSRVFLFNNNKLRLDPKHLCDVTELVCPMIIHAVDGKGADCRDIALLPFQVTSKHASIAAVLAC